MSKSPEHPEHVVVVAKAANEMEAGVMVAALEEEGIKATMSGGATVDFRIGVPSDVEILVAKEDEARAREIIERGEDDDEDVDWSQVDVGAAGRVTRLLRVVFAALTVMLSAPSDHLVEGH